MSIVTSILQILKARILHETFLGVMNQSPPADFPWTLSPSSAVSVVSSTSEEEEARERDLSFLGRDSGSVEVG